MLAFKLLFVIISVVVVVVVVLLLVLVVVVVDVCLEVTSGVNDEVDSFFGAVADVGDFFCNVFYKKIETKKKIKT